MGASDMSEKAATPVEESTAVRRDLELLKAQLFPPETSAERSARALEALRPAIKPCTLDAAALRYVAQHADLEDS